MFTLTLVFFCFHPVSVSVPWCVTLKLNSSSHPSFLPTSLLPFIFTASLLIIAPNPMRFSRPRRRVPLLWVWKKNPTQQWGAWGSVWEGVTASTCEVPVLSHLLLLPPFWTFFAWPNWGIFYFLLGWLWTGSSVPRWIDHQRAGWHGHETARVTSTRVWSMAQSLWCSGRVLVVLELCVFSHHVTPAQVNFVTLTCCRDVRWESLMITFVHGSVSTHQRHEPVVSVAPWWRSEICFSLYI